MLQKLSSLLNYAWRGGGGGISQVSRKQQQHMYVKNTVFPESTTVTNNLFCDNVQFLMQFSALNAEVIVHQLNAYEKVV